MDRKHSRLGLPRLIDNIARLWRCSLSGCTVFLSDVCIFPTCQFYNLNITQFVLIVAVIAFVLALELMNTAVERACDAITKDKHPLIKLAKDAAAGAVLVGAIASVVIGVLMFWDTTVLWSIVSSLCYSPEGLTIFILTLLASTVFVVVGPKEFVDSIKTMVELKKELENDDKEIINKSEDGNK